MMYANSVGKNRWPLWVATLIIGPALCILTNSSGAETAAQAAKRPLRGPEPPRLADGHPNWTGFWVPLNGMLENDIGLGGSPANADPKSTGFAPFSGYSALKSPYKERLTAAQQLAASGKVADPVSLCLPQGMPRMMGMIYGMELLQTPGQIAITSEYQANSRRVWLDQKAHTPTDELDPTYTGESIAHWEKDTLVIDTVGIRSDIPLNNRSLPHSDKLHIVERFSEPTPGILEDHAVIDDPDVFSSAWTEVLKFKYRPDLRIREYVCLENNRNVGHEGEAVFGK